MEKDFFNRSALIGGAILFSGDPVMTNLITALTGEGIAMDMARVVDRAFFLDFQMTTTTDLAWYIQQSEDLLAWEDVPAESIHMRFATVPPVAGVAGQVHGPTSAAVRQAALFNVSTHRRYYRFRWEATSISSAVISIGAIVKKLDQPAA